MRVAVTGATGHVGRALVPRLLARGCDVSVLSRDPANASIRLPGASAFSYDELALALARRDVVVHLATLNTDSAASEDEFAQVNVELPARVAESAVLAGVPRMVFCSSVHALAPERSSAYAESKRAAAARLSGVQDLDIRVVHLGAVRTDRLPRRLAPLERLPGPLPRIAYGFLAAVRPTTEIDQLVDFLLDPPVAAKAPEILTTDISKNAMYRCTIRALDVIGSFVGLGILAIIGPPIAWKLRAESPGGSLFRQERVGYRGRSFRLVKFRTMVRDSPNVATHDASPSAITPTGAMLRRTKLDELPQMLNVLRGELSLVGPRPCLPTQTELVEARQRCKILDAKPGITGLAQVRGIDMSAVDDLVAADFEYLHTRSIVNDLKIMVATVTGKGQGDRVPVSDGSQPSLPNRVGPSRGPQPDEVKL